MDNYVRFLNWRSRDHEARVLNRSYRSKSNEDRGWDGKKKFVFTAKWRILPEEGKKMA